MVRQVVWTEKAQNDRIAIFTYWNKHNGSAVFSKKLHELIKFSLQIICKHPKIGKATNKENVRVKVLRDYLIIYEVTEKEIIVLTIWDCRQNPNDLVIK
jgi:addiction module RelE/StbE family toxin